MGISPLVASFHGPICPETHLYFPGVTSPGTHLSGTHLSGTHLAKTHLPGNHFED